MQYAIAMNYAGQIVGVENVDGVVPVKREWAVVGESRQVVYAVEGSAVAGGAKRPAPGPVEAEKQPLREAAIQRGLHRVVIRGSAKLVQNDVAVTLVRPQEIGVQGRRAQRRAALSGVLILKQEGSSG